MVTTDQIGRLFANQPPHKNLLRKLPLLIDHNSRFISQNTLRASKKFVVHSCRYNKHLRNFFLIAQNFGTRLAN
jgi:hypothetical protein